MKFSVIFNLIVIIGATEGLFHKHDNARLSPSIIKSWTSKDLQDYLSDSGVSFDFDSGYEHLQDLASKQWSKVAYLGSPIATSSASGWWSSVKEKVPSVNSWTGSSLPSYQDMENFQDWIFNSWSKQDLYKFIHAHGVKLSNTQTSHVLSNSELIEVIKNHWSDIVNDVKSKTHKPGSSVSGRYPGYWIYESWNDKALKKWLDRHGIVYSKKDSRSELINLVRSHIYAVSQEAGEFIDGTKHFGDWMKKSAHDIYDTVGERVSFAADYTKYCLTHGEPFEGWNEDDIKEYLTSCKQDVKGSLNNAHENAITLFNEGKHESLKKYFEISLKVNQRIDKEKNNVAKFRDDSADALLRVKESMKSQVPSLLFDTLSLDDLKLWLQQHQKSTEGTADELYNRAMDTYEELVDQLKQENLRKVDTAAREYFQDWSLPDLQGWLQVHKENTEGTFEELYERAIKSFDSVYTGLADNFNTQLAKINSQSLPKFGGTTSWYGKVKSYFFDENPYLIKPEDNFATKLYKKSASNFNHYFLGNSY
ncbi:Msc1 protein [Saccharomycopsis crataegensis]|uniref:Msc1 protein n=1 Tax=Saccharomycopsis crataegensis TaxID=43959 RepID=A0AAV5QJQ8_9ASCO|nr:Msc1 protein [Saccharomycopsis crataegensis]